MPEDFKSSSGRIRVTLYEKRVVVGATSSLVGEFVELAIDGEPHAVIALEIPLAEFHDLFFKQVFPAVARRVTRSRKK
jgi:hypothetical protein